MTFILESLLQQPEGKTLEFKRDLSSSKPILKTLVAFANTAGGRLIIGITDDHQLIGVDDPLTEEDIKQGISKVRNTVIARVFRELHLIEQWGTGVRRIFSEAKALGLPEPQLIETGMRVRFIIPLLEPITLSRNIKPVEEQIESRPELQLESQINSALAAKVLLKLRHQDAGKSALAQHLGHKSVSGELKKQIKRLLDLDLIEMILPDKPNSRLQKYRLTTKGLELISDKGLPHD